MTSFLHTENPFDPRNNFVRRRIGRFVKVDEAASANVNSRNGNIGLARKCLHSHRNASSFLPDIFLNWSFEWRAAGRNWCVMLCPDV